MIQNLMNQDPRFYATANNGLLNLIAAANENYKNSPEFKAQNAEIMKLAFSGFCKGAMHGFFNSITDREYVLDKSRGNFANYKMIDYYYPNPKIICFVRNMPDIFASIEKLFRKNQYKSNSIVKHATMQGTSTPKRVNIWHQSFIPMMEYFTNSVRAEEDRKMLFIKYESFCLNPDIEMNKIYNYLEIETFKHDYTNIEQTIKEDEEVYEYTGMLKIRPKLEMNPSDAKLVLGEDVYTWIMRTYCGYNEYFEYK